MIAPVTGESDSVLIQFDNAGGITLQTSEFAHAYDDPAQAAEDYKHLADGGSTADWDGNDEDAKIQPHPECPIYDHDDIQTIIKSGEHDCSGYAETQFFRTLGVCVNGEE